MNRIQPNWKRAAVAAAKKQNARQRKAARPAHGGFGDCTTGAALSLIASFSAAG